MAEGEEMCLVRAQLLRHKTGGLHHQGARHTRRLPLTVGHSEHNGVHPRHFHVEVAGIDTSCAEEVPATGKLDAALEGSNTCRRVPALLSRGLASKGPACLAWYRCLDAMLKACRQRSFTISKQEPVPSTNAVDATL